MSNSWKFVLKKYCQAHLARLQQCYSMERHGRKRGDCPSSGHVHGLSKQLCYQSFGSVIMTHSIWLPVFVICFMNFCKSFAVKACTTFL